MHFWFTMGQIKTKNMSNEIICRQKCPMRLKCLTNLYRQKDLHACTYHKVTCLRAYIMKKIFNLMAIWPQYDQRKLNCLQWDQKPKKICELYKLWLEIHLLSFLKTKQEIYILRWINEMSRFEPRPLHIIQCPY